MEEHDTPPPSDPRPRAPSDGAAGALTELLATTLLVAVWIELLRVWLPTLVFSSAEGRFSPTTLLVQGVGLSVVASVVGVVLLRRLRPAGLLLVGALLLIAGRSGVALTLASGGDPNLLATTGVLGGILVVLALAADGHDPRRARVGVATGVVVATLLHTLTDTVGLLWAASRATMVVAIVLAVLAGAAAVAMAVRSWQRGRAKPLGEPSAAWPWLTLIPLLVLVLAVSGVPGRIATISGWDGTRTAAAVVGLHLGLLVAAMAPVRWPGLRVNGLVVVALPTATLAITTSAGWSALIGLGVLSLALGLLVGAAEPRATGAAARTRAGVAGLALVVSFGAIGTMAVATRTTVAGIDGERTLLLVALVGAVLAWRAAREPRQVTVRAQAPVLTTAIAAALAVSGAGASAVLANLLPMQPALPDVRDLDAPQVRVGLYNIRHGFDVHGRFAAHHQAELLRGLDLDVLVLNDVDRGWFATGGHDSLQVLSRELGFSQVLFGAGSDPLYGNALLTRAEVVESAVDRLPAVGEPLRRNQVAAVIVWPDDESRLGIVGTHLSEGAGNSGVRIPQARAVAGTVALLRERQVPTVMLGDLNAPPGSAELGTFATLLDDALPDGVATYPADDPTEHLDHVLVSPELRRIGLELPATDWSDHLPVVVTLELRDAD